MYPFKDTQIRQGNHVLNIIYRRPVCSIDGFDKLSKRLLFKVYRKKTLSVYLQRPQLSPGLNNSHDLSNLHFLFSL